MFSLDRFYKVIHANLIRPLSRGCSIYFYPFGTYSNRGILYQPIDDAYDMTAAPWNKDTGFLHCYFFDQEPLYDFTTEVLDKSLVSFKELNEKIPNRVNILATSEKSSLVTNITQTEKFYNWYYFFHGFAALDWYRDFQYLPDNCFTNFDKVFICYNHLTTKYRSYRLHLVSNLLNRDLVKFGHVSLFHTTTWNETVKDPTTPLDNRARVSIYKTLRNITDDLIIDASEPCGSMSANVAFDQLTSALWHIVTETVYFLPKLHLTEKTFKPIVAKRPFILVAAPGNLAYLKSYGFKTFDRWIDESYDQETDNYLRIEKVTAEIEKLCALSPAKLERMYSEMQEVLEYNFNHFYTTFKRIITDELVDNFAAILAEANYPEYQHSPEYLQSVKQRLLR